MKKLIFIAIIALVVVFNFTLVKSKTGDVNLKSMTELAVANADSEHPDIQISTSLVNTGSYRLIHNESCSVYGCPCVAVRYNNIEKFRRTVDRYIWDGTQYVYDVYIYDGELEVSIENYCYCHHHTILWVRNPPIPYTN